MSNRAVIPLFGAYGIELEYMIVDRRKLSVLPIADRVLRDALGHPQSEVRHGALCWSNELAAHLIELKTARPTPSLSNAEDVFHEGVRHINKRLSRYNAMLMPTAAHPWMNPRTECRLWSHDHGAIYQAFHNVFDCRGHGWVNLQSCHFNLPFHTAEEFGRLHAAIRVILPLLPALAASSPYLNGRRTRWLDARLREYRRNCRRIPSVTGAVIPERVFTPYAYRRNILDPMYRDIAPFDPHGILQHEWLNARGAIARFERHTIEIRVLDVQECPRADCAILEFVAATLKALVTEQWSSYEHQKKVGTAFLSNLLMQSARVGPKTPINRPSYAALFGQKDALTLRDLLQGLFDGLQDKLTPAHREALTVILEQGTLAERIQKSARSRLPSRATLSAIYRRLCACLDDNQMFLP